MFSLSVSHLKCIHSFNRRLSTFRYPLSLKLITSSHSLSLFLSMHTVDLSCGYRCVSHKLLYQRLAFVFHFNFTISPFYIDFQCKTSPSNSYKAKEKQKWKEPEPASRQERESEHVCVCLSVYNMMQSNPFILCMRHLTVFDICKSNATNDITHSDRSQGAALAFAVCIIQFWLV